MANHSYSQADIDAALDACAREPVHTPGAIQPVGCLISLDADLKEVRQVSANLEAVVGIGVDEALMGLPEDLLGRDLIARLHRELDHHERLSSPIVTHLGSGAKRAPFHLVAYRSGTRVVVELENTHPDDGLELLGRVNELLVEIAWIEDSDTLLQALTCRVQELTGHDRVMVYRFDGEWNGRVVAEHRLAGTESYLGHHFPASDIPAQVRALYDINRVRSIPDAASPAVPLVPAEDPADPAALDLSPGSLRAVSPIHQEYLANMGVAASLSVAMQDEKALWGLVACHGLRPRTLSVAVRDAVRALVQIAMSRLMLIEARHEASLLRSIHDNRELLTSKHGQRLGPEAMLKRHGRRWLELLRAEGVALVRDGKTSGVGQLPPEDNLIAMAEWLNKKSLEADGWQTRSLGKTPLSPLQHDDLCGLVAVPLPTDSRQSEWLLLFRAEQHETRLWAGKPEDTPMVRQGRLIMTPRRSFAQWQEEVRGLSLTWTLTEHRVVGDLAKDLAVLSASHEVAVLNKRLNDANQRLRTLAYNDSLTGVWNRYRMELAIDAEINAADRYGSPCTLLLFDVDHFKHFNDTHGHEAGDRVLIELCETIQNSLRISDTLGRWGGEEFLVLASHSDRKSGLQLAERLRQVVEDMDLGDLGRVTISIGIADWRKGDTRKRLVARADRAMYRAKEGGRNRVEVDDEV
jgi:diguanylate cyclase (GGDEF)-like protein